jgi:hypothetical protein
MVNVKAINGSPASVSTAEIATLRGQLRGGLLLDPVLGIAEGFSVSRTATARVVHEGLTCLYTLQAGVTRFCGSRYRRHSGDRTTLWSSPR